MRQKLKNYLNLEGIRTEDVADKIGKSRETIRSWSKSKNMVATAHFDPATYELFDITISKSKTFKVER